LQLTEAAGVQWPHVEDVNALHLSEDFETLETGGLLGIGRNRTRLCTGREKVGFSLDLCEQTMLALGILRDKYSRLLVDNAEKSR
jgi:hypothetical protein